MQFASTKVRDNASKSTLLAVGLLALSVFLGIFVPRQMPGLELGARDWLLRRRGNLPPSTEIVIVAIDEASLQHFGRFPWPRNVMAQALRQLNTAHPKAIALDVLYSELSQESEDRALAEAVAAGTNVIVAAQLANTADERGTEQTVWLRPFPALQQAAAGLGHVNVLTGHDGVARALLLQQSDDAAQPLWALAVETLRVGTGRKSDEVRLTPHSLQLGPHTLPLAEDFSSNDDLFQADAPLLAVRPTALWLDYAGPTGLFAAQTFSFNQAYAGRIPAEALRGKYVLIGATAAALGDRLATPFMRAETNDGRGRDELMPGVEVLANTLNTVLQQRFYRETAAWLAGLCATLTTTLTFLALARMQGRLEWLKQLLVLAVLGGAIIGGSQFAFNWWLVFPPLTPMLIALLTSAPLALLWRSMLVSAQIDQRINELAQAGAQLLLPAQTGRPTTLLARPPRWWPRGGAWKAEQLGALARRGLERARFVEHTLLAVEDGLLVAEVNGRLQFANPRAAEMLNVTERALLGTDLFERLAAHIHDEPRALRARVLAERAPVERELSIGPQHYVLRLAAVRDEHETPLGWVAALADVTEQRALQQTRNDVMALVTHELKTPLTAIQGMSNVLAEFDDGRLETERRRTMHLAINDEAKRLARMIDEYLNLARLESGAQALRLSSVRPAQLLERVLLLLDPLATQRGSRLTRAFPQDLPPLLADADLLTQAVTNLVANALKFSPAQTQVTITALADEMTLHIAITDQGCGIPAASLPHIFEKFYRVPRVEEADAPGTGLGLALVREVAERHGGRVTVESKEGSGTTFTLHLPRAQRISQL